MGSATTFRRRLLALNEAQRQAVETIDGPMLVIAGPGTGKTELLSMRVANILRQADVAASNVLCVTFTDNAARNMRERLIDIVGQPAYHVAIHTFHSFGADIFNQFPDQFSDRQFLQQVDELGKYQLVKELFDQLPHHNPLSPQAGGHYLFLLDTIQTISWLKQNAVTPTELHQLLNKNHLQMEASQTQLSDCFAARPAAKHLPAYGQLLNHLQKLSDHTPGIGFPDFAQLAAAELQEAITQTPPDGRYATPITAWRNRWCQKNAAGQHVWADAGQAYRRLQAVAHVYQQLQETMIEQGLYDFDDMVMEAVQALETNQELRFNLQERYQYVLVDEFQDTNKAQLRLLRALGDNPVFENRPNIMAVGDDDQAIYAFQGAEVSNLSAFTNLYREPLVISLTQNYRSTAAILQASQAVAGQISQSLLGQPKQLSATQRFRQQHLAHQQFTSELSQYDWIAQTIAGLVKKGVKPSAIGVIAPRHRYLERLMPYLGRQQVPVAYERRENILEAPLILQLLAMSRLVTALANNQQAEADQLFGEVLSYEFWQLPAEVIIEVSLAAYQQHAHWLGLLSSHPNRRLRAICKWFVGLAGRSRLEPMEYILDQLIGGEPGGIDSEYDELTHPKSAVKKFRSPLGDFYFDQERYDQATDQYLALLGQLATLRHRLRQWQPRRTLFIHDLVEFVSLHQTANIKIVDTNPHTQTTNAVQVMTVYKAKGLEFDYVFMINAQDEIWGPTARHLHPRIRLPGNLPIAPAGDQPDDQLRLLYVAMTRAKHHLYVCSYRQDLDNRLSPELSFIAAVPELQPTAVDQPAPRQAIAILSTDWAYRYRKVIAKKADLLEPILADYKLSVTHLNNFLDVANGGPTYFLTHNLLRFPEALTPSAAYGDAIHRTLQWIYMELKHTNDLPALPRIEDFFSDVLQRKHLKETDRRRLDARGRAALAGYLQNRGSQMVARDLVERGFNNDGVVINEARLSGKIDLLHYLPGKAVEVRDFKTGRPATSWRGKDGYEQIKLHKYRQQLLFYKLLVEQSASFANQLHVSQAALEFVEPDDNGQLVDNLSLQLDPNELTRFASLIGTVWQHIIKLDFPDVDGYPKNLKGIQAFEQDLLDKKL